MGGRVKEEVKVLTRSKHGLISGTLSGIAEYLGISKGRLQFVFVILGLMGIGVLFYLVLWVSIPRYGLRETLLAKKNRS